MSEVAVAMSGVTKLFGSVAALSNVDIAVRRGSIHAIVGENGAGKTTLMRVLYGAIRPDHGQIAVEGNPVSFSNTAQAISAGIGMVSQHYSIIGELTCLQNLMLGAEPGSIIDLRGARNRAEELASKMGFSFKWESAASNLSPAGAQKLEILKLLWRNARIMILDEPTAMLSPADGDALFDSLRQLTSEGATVLLVTHRLPEVMTYCERVTVLRGGKLIFDKLVSEVTASELAEGIVGHALTETATPEPIGDSASVLSVSDLTVKGARGNEAVRSASLEVRAGEILGIAGVDGSGQRELFHSLMGLAKPSGGSIKLNQLEIVGKATRQLIDLGVRLIPEDRHEEGLIEEWSLEENAALGFQRYPEMSAGPLVSKVARREAAEEFATRFTTKHGGLGLPIASLSGGNQQRFVAARALAFSPVLVLAFQPARGLDIDATQNVYEGLRQACRAGAGCLVVSYDLDELLAYCDRIVAMNDGVVYAPPIGSERSRAVIGQLMVGAL